VFVNYQEFGFDFSAYKPLEDGEGELDGVVGKAVQSFLLTYDYGTAALSFQVLELRLKIDSSKFETTLTVRFKFMGTENEWIFGIPTRDTFLNWLCLGVCDPATLKNELAQLENYRRRQLRSQPPVDAFMNATAKPFDKYVSGQPWGHSIGEHYRRHRRALAAGGCRSARDSIDLQDVPAYFSPPPPPSEPPSPAPPPTPPPSSPPPPLPPQASSILEEFYNRGTDLLDAGTAPEAEWDGVDFDGALPGASDFSGLPSARRMQAAQTPRETPAPWQRHDEQEPRKASKASAPRQRRRAQDLAPDELSTTAEQLVYYPRPADFALIIQNRLSFSAILEKIGPINKTIDYSVNTPVLDGGFACRATVLINPTLGVRVSMAVAIDFLGISIAGSGTLTSRGGIEEMLVMGVGSISVPACDACPELSGTVRFEKLPSDPLPTLYQQLSFSFLDMQVSGSAKFRADRTVESFAFDGSVNTFELYLLKEKIITGIADTTSADNLFVRILDAAFILTAASVKVSYTGGAFVDYEISLQLGDRETMLRFRLVRLPTSLLDLFSLIGQLGVELLQAVAPMDYTLTVGEISSDPICAGFLPCLCGPRLQCVQDRRRSLSSAVRNVTEASLGDTSGRVHVDSRLSWPVLPTVATSWPLAKESPTRSATRNTSTPGKPTRANGSRDRRRLLFCGWGKSLRLQFTQCCGDKLCANSPVRVQTNFRLQVTTLVATVTASARLILLGPGQGLKTFDETLSTTLSVGYGSATSLCDLVPGLRSFNVGSMPGGSVQLCALGYCININLPQWNGIALHQVLPCDRLRL